MDLLIPVLVFASFGIWVWMLIDCITKEPSEGNDKIVWILVVVLTGIIGALIYLFYGRPKRKQQFGK